MKSSNRLLGIVFIVGLFLGIGIGAGAFFIREPVGEFAKDIRVLVSFLAALDNGGDEERVDTLTPSSINIGDGPNADSLLPPYISRVPKDQFPEGPIPSKFFNNPSKRVVEIRSVEEIRNGWAFLHWFFYSVMMRDIKDAREYVQNPVIVDRFFLELVEEDLWSGRYYPLATHLTSFSSDSPEDGVTVDARINFIEGNILSTEGVPVTAVIQFIEGRWWLTSIHRTR